MKTIKFLLVACLLGMAATASAQFANSGAAGGDSSDAEAWSGIRLSYNPVSIDVDGGDNFGLTGISATFVKSFSVTSSAPLFVETGLGISWIGGEFVEDSGLDVSVFSLNIPVNFGYKYVVNETTSIFPFIGITLRGNLFGSYSAGDESVNAFDDSEDEAGPLALNRFQIGWQIGVGANFNKFYVGASYGNDFSEILDDACKASVPAITVGYNF